MSEQTDETQGASGLIPAEKWMPTPVSDWADYADRQPTYVGDLSGEAKAEAERAFALRKNPPKPVETQERTTGSKRARRRAKRSGS